jgi:hypothetical protein
VHVRARASLSRAMSQHGPGTTYCLAAGKYKVRATITTEDGDKITGAGRDATFINGRRIPATNGRIFITQGHTTFANLDISGARTPSDASTLCMSTNGTVAPASCGKAFVNNADVLTLKSVDCHDNDANCVAGAGSLDVNDLECWDNGSDYSMTRGFGYAGCVKMVAAYTQGDGNFTLTNSYIHDQPGNGIWCDHCKYGSWVIEGNRFVHNGNHAVQWEMSGGWTSDDRALVRNNTFRKNGWRTDRFAPGGVIISTANDIIVEGNTFGGQAANGAYAVYILFGASRNAPQPDARGVVVQNNALNGDPLEGCGLTGVTCTDNA